MPHSGGLIDDIHSRGTTERPAAALSVRLLATYREINDAYNAEKRQQFTEQLQLGGTQVENDGYDDAHGNYIVQMGEELCGRFVVKELLGRGSFGVVVKALDRRRGDFCAIKIVRNRPAFTAQAMSEMAILTILNAETGENDRIVRLRKYFSWRSHLCLVFELLSYNLYDLIKFTRFEGVSLALVRTFGYQICCALSALRRLPIPVIHGDLKPENILLQHPDRSLIKVIDFGSACHVNKTIYRYIQSRYYRSPEVILGLEYDCGIDAWSLGCILFELYLGHPLFSGATELDQLHQMRSVLGDVPQPVVQSSYKRAEFYTRNSRNEFVLRASMKDRTTAATLAPEKPTYVVDPIGTVVPHTTELVQSRLQQLVLAKQTSGVKKGGGPTSAQGEEPRDLTSSEFRFIELLEGMLRYDRALRTTPADWLSHPWFEPLHCKSHENQRHGLARPACRDGLDSPTSVALEMSNSVHIAC